MSARLYLDYKEIGAHIRAERTSERSAQSAE